MKLFKLTVFVAACLIGVLHTGADAQSNKVRIGVYDSRAIAVAYGASDLRNTQGDVLDQDIKKAQEERAKAKTTHGAAREKELKAKLLDLRQRRAQQAFGFAPVDDIIEVIKDRLPEIQRQTKVETFVSKWDEKELSKYKSAELVDVTLPLVAEFNPSKKTLQSVWAVQQEKPISAGKIKTAVKKGF